MNSSLLASSLLSELLIDVSCLPDAFSVLCFVSKQEVLFVGVKYTLYLFGEKKANKKNNLSVFFFFFNTQENI